MPGNMEPVREKSQSLMVRASCTKVVTPKPVPPEVM